MWACYTTHSEAGQLLTIFEGLMPNHFKSAIVTPLNKKPSIYAGPCMSTQGASLTPSPPRERYIILYQKEIIGLRG